MHERWPRIRVAWVTGLDREGLRPVEGSVAIFDELEGPRSLVIAGADTRVPDLSDASWLSFRFRLAHAPESSPEPAQAAAVLAVRVFADPADRDEFRRWLDAEHAPLQVSIPDVQWYLGYEEEHAPHSFLNLWGLDDPAVVDGPAWADVRDTPWWHRVEHVTAGADRATYRPARRVSAGTVAGGDDH